MTTDNQENFEFTCNICGTVNARSFNERHRELLQCIGCHSCARFRGVVKAIQTCVLGEATLPPLATSRPVPEIRGIGMSDADAYAAELARMFDYTNTYYHTAPLLDVTDEASCASYRDLDFVISSDVLEHVRAPVINSLRNIYGMLRPGGHLILTVPYLEGYETIEHFPHLHDYIIAEVGGSFVLVNKRTDGEIEIHRNLCFHGGPGSVLEMRIFGEGDLFSMLHVAGYQPVHVLTPDDAFIGYSWDDAFEPAMSNSRVNKSYVLVCRKPSLD